MRSRRFVWLTLTLLLLVMPCAASAQKRIAVLEIRGDGSIETAGLRFLADKVREAALVHMGTENWEVMTQENMLVLLEANAADLAACEGECEVQTGRLLGAHVVVAGSQVRFGSSYELVLRSYETETGKLIASSSASASSLDELRAQLDGTCARLFGSGMSSAAQPKSDSQWLEALVPASCSVSAVGGTFLSGVLKILKENESMCVPDLQKEYCGVAWVFELGDAEDIDKERTAIQEVVRVASGSRFVRRTLAGTLARYANCCWDDFEVGRARRTAREALATYERISDSPPLSTCIRVCDPLDDPNWGLVSYRADRTRSDACYYGCDGTIGTEHDAMLWFIHRQVLRGVTAAEMRDLLDLVDDELGAKECRFEGQ